MTGPTKEERTAARLGWRPEPGEDVWVHRGDHMHPAWCRGWVATNMHSTHGPSSIRCHVHIQPHRRKEMRIFLADLTPRHEE